MKIIIFCDTLGYMPRFWSAFRRDGRDLRELCFLICNNGRRPAWLFLAIQFAHAFRRYCLRNWIDLVSLLWRRRLLVSFTPLGSPSSLKFLQRMRPDIGLHAMGVIYRKNVIELCGAGILNAHIGKLPNFRGRSVMEWSILCGEPTGVTVFFIDSGIDTGSRIIHWEPIPVENARTVADAKADLFSRDAQLYHAALRKIAAGFAPQPNDVAQGRRFYEMSSLFTTVVERHFSHPASAN